MNFLLPSLAWWMDVSVACLQEYPLCTAVTRRSDLRCRKCSHDQLWHQLNSLTAQGHVEQPNALLREDTSPGGVGSERGRDHSSLSPFSTTKMARWFVLRQFERECLIDNPCLAIIILMSIWMDERRQAKKRERGGGGCNMKRESEDWGEWKLNGSGARARLLKWLSCNPRLSYNHMSACCSYRCCENQILTSATGQNWPDWPFRHYILEVVKQLIMTLYWRKWFLGASEAKLLSAILSLPFSIAIFSSM